MISNADSAPVAQWDLCPFRDPMSEPPATVAPKAFAPSLRKSRRLLSKPIPDSFGSMFILLSSPAYRPWCTTLFVRFLVLDSIQYSNPTFWSASSREQPSSTSTVSLSTVRRGGLSTSTTKSDARHDLWLIVWADRCICSIGVLRRISSKGYLGRTRRVVARMQCVRK
jgi:hypothetical protein